jgi:hypothetical protein
MEATRSSETSVPIRATRSYFPEDDHQLRIIAETSHVTVFEKEGFGQVLIGLPCVGVDGRPRTIILRLVIHLLLKYKL